jgi:hypothetical protein
MADDAMVDEVNFLARHALRDEEAHGALAHDDYLL